VGDIDNIAEPAAIANPKATLNHCVCVPSGMRFIYNPHLLAPQHGGNIFSLYTVVNHLISQLNTNIVTKSEHGLRMSLRPLRDSAFVSSVIDKEHLLVASSKNHITLFDLSSATSIIHNNSLLADNEPYSY
jgi:hypothetical protein